MTGMSYLLMMMSLALSYGRVRRATRRRHATIQRYVSEYIIAWVASSLAQLGGAQQQLVAVVGAQLWGFGER